MFEFLPPAREHRVVISALWFVLVGGCVVACQPTVQVAPPSEPITINLNIKLDAEVRLKLEEQAKSDIEDNPDIF